MKLLPVLSIFLILLSCNKDESINISPPPTQQNPLPAIEIYVYQCETVHCDTENPLVGVMVELFSSEEDALTSQNPYRSNTTNEEGKVIFSNIDQDLVYIKIVTEDYGTYIESQRTSTNTVKVFHDVRYDNGYEYNNNGDRQLTQRHISLSNPAVGQVSNYVYHFADRHISFTPLEYSEVKLNVRIVDQIDANSYVVKEEINMLAGYLGSPFSPKQNIVTSLWRFENDVLQIIPYENEYFGSFAWNLSEFYFNPQSEIGYSFSLIRPSNNGIDMNTDIVENIRWWETGFAADYTLFGHTYDELITDAVSYTGIDGPAIFRVYSLDDGLVRSLDFWNGGAPATQGFDLVLE
jgi:hypothetical protein